ncbi:hypothetical protein R3P38DRAFT_1295793 [Favolaschia claudopus]|uniref:F-box domain-containing protein n=1 Tax=Favolaschia claudopus TaxID=2862362 RepID=A0AAW0AX87_9AGAR
MLLSSPLAVPELLDACITHLSDSPHDLIACSLVARSWVNAAQRNLFHTPHETNRAFTHDNLVVIKLQNALLTSPHLIRYVREICIVVSGVADRPVLAGFCSLPFTNLRKLSLDLTNPCWPPLRPLLELSTLRVLCLLTTRGISFYLDLLKSCPTVRHLVLQGEIEPFVGTSPAPLYLASLCLNLLPAANTNLSRKKFSFSGL